MILAIPRCNAPLYLSFLRIFQGWTINSTSLHPIFDLTANDLPRYISFFFSNEIEGNGRDRQLTSL